MEKLKQELYIGPRYGKENGLYPQKRILIVGHQKNANSEEEKKIFKEAPLKYLKISTNLKDNKELIISLINGDWKEWVKKKEDRHKRKTYLQFGRIMSGNKELELGNEESNILWESIAFCNFLQTPHFGDGAMGEDAPELYEYSKTIFIDYLKEAKPDHVIVWGTHAYNCVKSLAVKNIDGRQCEIILDTGDVVPVLRINHPCIVREGYEKAHEGLDQFLNGE